MTISRAAPAPNPRKARIEHGLLPRQTLPIDRPHPVPLLERLDVLGVPGVSVAVIQDGQVEWTGGYGVREAGVAGPVSAETMFQAASISKPVTALAVLQLVQEGVLDLDEDVNRYLRSWKVPANGPWQPRITLRHLLSHTAGMTVHGFPGYTAAGPMPSLREILDGTGRANTFPIRVDSPAGLQFRYSGGGTTVVQQLLLHGLPYWLCGSRSRGRHHDQRRRGPDRVE